MGHRAIAGPMASKLGGPRRLLWPSRGRTGPSEAVLLWAGCRGEPVLAESSFFGMHSRDPSPRIILGSWSSPWVSADSVEGTHAIRQQAPHGQG
uniref:Uncharacterized protein n=1 Tax=Oryza glaberrima TaxID=4538 RepID=I1QKN2_ORYGL